MPSGAKAIVKVSHIVLILAGMMAIFSISSGCNSPEKGPDISGVKLPELQTYRFDKDLAAIDTNHISAGLEQLSHKYPDFLNFYLDTLMGFNIHGNYNDTIEGIREGLRIFLTHKDYRGLFDTVAKHYPDTKEVDAALKKGFQYMKYYFSDFREPKVYYTVAGLNKLGAYTDSTTILGIDLDMFLGGDYPFYRSVEVPEYMSTHLVPAYIPVAAFSAIYESGHPFVREDRNLLDMMIQRGKEQYFLHKVLPFVPDSTLFGYRQSQLDWCRQNEGEIYSFFVREEMLYSNDWQKILRYVIDGPNSTGMPPQSPGNIGTWVGWRIVNAYMQEHPQVPLPQLLALRGNAQQFLAESKYKPK